VLDTAHYKLLVSMEKRYRARNDPALHVQVSNDALRYHRLGPLWDWPIHQKYGYLLSCGYGAFALLPMIFLVIVKICKQENLILEFIYAVLFLLVKVYCWVLLDIQRHICYIKVLKEDPLISHISFRPLYIIIQIYIVPPSLSRKGIGFKPFSRYPYLVQH
jgi:hypothetical protein